MFRTMHRYRRRSTHWARQALRAIDAERFQCGLAARNSHGSMRNPLLRAIAFLRGADCGCDLLPIAEQMSPAIHRMRLSSSKAPAGTFTAKDFAAALRSSSIMRARAANHMMVVSEMNASPACIRNDSGREMAGKAR